MTMISEHELYDVVKFEIVDDYTLWLQFDDGFERTIDFELVLYGEVFEPLRDLELFNQVTLNPDTGTIEWPTGADFDPETLHNWPNYVAEIRQRREQVTALADREQRGG
jgi:hypothetical protein